MSSLLTAPVRRAQRWFVVTGLTALLAAVPSLHADPVAELASFSVFDNVDLVDLAKNDAKTAAGPTMNEPRFISVQSCWVEPVPASKLAAALKVWNPQVHKELKIMLHGDISGSPDPKDFEKLSSAPDNSAVKSLVGVTTKMGSELQISKDEAKKFSGGDTGGKGAIPANVAQFWNTVLAERARSFVSGGAGAAASYDHSGESIQPGQEFSALLRQQEKIRKQFSGFLGQAGVGKGGPSSPDLYWELVDVDGKGVLSLGASYSRPAGNGSYQAGDILYYASGGYYVALTLFQLWPVTVDGKPGTLIWRGDMTSSSELAGLHGVERVGSEGAMRKDILKTVTLFRRDTAGGN